VTVDNAGPDPAENVVATDTLPAGVTLAATNGCAQDPTGLVCSLGTIPVNGSAQYTIAVIVDAGTAGTITNSATVVAGTADPNPNNNTASEDTLVGEAPVAVDTAFAAAGNTATADAGATFVQGSVAPGTCLVPVIP
jgi:hypothetical protein